MRRRQAKVTLDTSWLLGKVPKRIKRPTSQFYFFILNHERRKAWKAWMPKSREWWWRQGDVRDLIGAHDITDDPSYLMAHLEDPRRGDLFTSFAAEKVDYVEALHELDGLPWDEWYPGGWEFTVRRRG